MHLSQNEHLFLSCKSLTQIHDAQTLNNKPYTSPNSNPELILLNLKISHHQQMFVFLNLEVSLKCLHCKSVTLLLIVLTIKSIIQCVILMQLISQIKTQNRCTNLKNLLI